MLLGEVVNTDIRCRVPPIQHAEGMVETHPMPNTLDAPRGGDTRCESDSDAVETINHDCYSV